MTRTSARLGRRAALLAAAGMGLVGLLTGCGAGQITQTDTQVAAVPGANASVGSIALRDVLIPFDTPEGYPAGGTAPLSVRLFNSGPADELTAVTSSAARSVVLTVPRTTSAPSEPAGQQVCPSGTVSADAPREPVESPSPSESPSASGTASATPSGTASPSPTPSASASEGEPAADEAPGAESFRVSLPADQGCALLVPGQGPYLQLVGLQKPLRPGETVPVTFRFARSGEVTLNVTIGPPSERASRSPLDIHPEEGGHE